MRCKTPRNKGTGRLAVSCILYKKYLQILGTTMYQKTCIFHLILLGIQSSLVLSVKSKGMGGGGLLGGQNLLSVAKVVRR